MRRESNDTGNRLLKLDVTDIQRLLKNRYPLLMLDRVEEIFEGKSARGFKNFTYNEWFFPGHFEDNPNVPGVVSLEALIEIFIMSFITLPECIGKETADRKIDNLQFTRQIVPGDRLDVTSELKRFRLGVAIGTSIGYVNGKKACSCELTVCVPSIINRLKPTIDTE